MNLSPSLSRLSSLLSTALLALLASCDASPTPPVVSPPPLVHAHAHNDYNHPRPLLDALDLGFCSVEADVWLVGDELLVGHDKSELKAERTLEALYLRPLAVRCDRGNGWVYESGRTVTLLVDLKTGGDAYEVLKRQLEKHRALFEPRAASDDGRDTASARPVAVILSGERPLEAFAAEENPLGAMDGRIGDYAAEKSAERMPLVSDAWPKQFAWNGAGEFPAGQRDKLRRLVADVHARGRRLRFWATPDDEAVWTELLDEGVDLIGADDIQKLARFLAARPPAANSAK